MKPIQFAVLIYTFTMQIAWCASANVPTKGPAVASIELEAHRIGERVDLKWSIAGIVKRFHLERSLDGEVWEPLPSMGGSNQTFHRTEYFDVDYGVPSSKLYYRIRLQAHSGEEMISKTAFVPAFDELSMFEERMIKTILDPIKAGAKIKLRFVNFDGEDLLLVLRDQCGLEYYAKVVYLHEEELYLVKDISDDIPSGQYLITASSSRDIYSSQLRIELAD